MANVVQPENVPKDLICAVCMSVPLKPRSLRVCEHVFCEDCILQCSGQNNSLCPMDRVPFSSSDVMSFQQGSLVFRIWSAIIIRCDNSEMGCAWTGSISDYDRHHGSCKDKRKRKRFDSDQRLIESLKEDKATLLFEVLPCLP